MDCLNGIRVFSALWVIYAHAHVMTMLAPIFNFAYVPEVDYLTLKKKKKLKKHEINFRNECVFYSRIFHPKLDLSH